MQMSDTDYPDLDFYIEVECESIRRRRDAMANDIDSPEDWHFERLESEMFDDELKEVFVKLMFREELLHVIKQLHRHTGCSMYMASMYAIAMLDMYYSDMQEAVKCRVRDLHD